MSRAWWQNKLINGICPMCGTQALEDGKSGCTRCLARQAKAARKYRKNHKNKTNAYMRAYMRTYRLKSRQKDNNEDNPNPERAALLARLAALQYALPSET